MAIDYSKFSDDDLQALADDDYTKLSDKGLKLLEKSVTNTGNKISIDTSKPQEASFASNEGGAAFGNPNIGRRKKEQPEQREITPVESGAAAMANRAFAQPAIGITQLVTGGTVGGDKAREFDQESTRYQQANPISYGAGAVGGEVLKSLAPVKNLGPVTGGAIYGGASGAVTPNLSKDTGTDYYLEQAKNAALGAGIGATAGGLFNVGKAAYGAYKAGDLGSATSAVKILPERSISPFVNNKTISEAEKSAIMNRGERIGVDMVPKQVTDEFPKGVPNQYTSEVPMKPKFGAIFETDKKLQGAMELAKKEWSDAKTPADYLKTLVNMKTGYLPEMAKVGMDTLMGRNMTAIPGSAGKFVNTPTGVFPTRTIGDVKTQQMRNNLTQVDKMNNQFPTPAAARVAEEGLPPQQISPVQEMVGAMRRQEEMSQPTPPLAKLEELTNPENQVPMEAVTMPKPVNPAAAPVVEKPPVKTAAEHLNDIKTKHPYFKEDQQAHIAINRRAEDIIKDSSIPGLDKNVAKQLAREEIEIAQKEIKLQEAETKKLQQAESQAQAKAKEEAYAQSPEGILETKKEQLYQSLNPSKGIIRDENLTKDIEKIVSANPDKSLEELINLHKQSKIVEPVEPKRARGDWSHAKTGETTKEEAERILKMIRERKK